MEAARKGHQSVVELLIKAGARLDIQDMVGVYDRVPCMFPAFALEFSQVPHLAHGVVSNSILDGVLYCISSV